MRPFCPEGKWRPAIAVLSLSGSGPAPALNSDKRPPAKLQFHQFHGSFRILAFVVNAAAVAVAKKRRRELSYNEALRVV